jgi:hypothetical protein
MERMDESDGPALFASGAKDSFYIYLDPKLIARVATTSFELGLPPAQRFRHSTL